MHERSPFVVSPGRALPQRSGAGSPVFLSSGPRVASFRPTVATVAPPVGITATDVGAVRPRGGTTGTDVGMVAPPVGTVPTRVGTVATHVEMVGTPRKVVKNSHFWSSTRRFASKRGVFTSKR